MMTTCSTSPKLGLVLGGLLLPSLLSLAACGGAGADDAQSRYLDDPGTYADGAPIPVGVTGVPCDVVKALSGCVSCHSSSPSGGAPMSLVSHADLMAPSAVDPAQTNAQRSVVRMMDTKSPMPPSPAAHATSADIAALTAWIAAGGPAGTCGGGTVDGGVPSTTGGDAAAATATGVPCDVAKAFASCTSCHSSSPSSGAPMALVSYSDLTLVSAKFPTQTYVQRSVVRM
jgi:hypothetical protein